MTENVVRKKIKNVVRKNRVTPLVAAAGDTSPSDATAAVYFDDAHC